MIYYANFANINLFTIGKRYITLLLQILIYLPLRNDILGYFCKY